MVRILAIIRDLTDSIALDKIKEAFYNGLADETNLEMAPAKTHALPHIYWIISETENLVIQQRTLSRRKGVEKNRRRDYPSERKTTEPKYCRFAKHQHTLQMSVGPETNNL